MRARTSVSPVFLSRASIERARKRVRSEPWASPIAGKLRQAGRELASAQLPVFESAWWKEASKKHWTQTYPEINHHTFFAVKDAAVRSADAAYAFTLTADERCLDAATRVLLHYSGYRFFAKHPDVGLNWSVWCLRLLIAFDLARSRMDDSGRARVEDFLRRAREAVREDDEWWIAENPGGLFNNHFAWHKLFIGALGLFFDEPEDVVYAIESDQGIRDLIEQGSRDDGLWLEASLNYHFTALAPLALFARMLRESGNALDLWTHEFANGRTLKALFAGPVGTAFPDKTLPTVGDAYGHRMDLSKFDLYYLAYDACGAPETGWLAKDRQNLPVDALFLERLPGPELAPPAMETRIWPSHGYAALRTGEGAGYWNGRGFSAFLTFGQDGIHGHCDRLSFTAFGRGRHLAVDPEALASEEHKFSARVQSELNRHTICHNTLMVDGASHGPVRAKLQLVDFVDNPGLKMATVADGGALYPGVRVMRTLAVTEQGILDVLQAVSDARHTFDYLFHGVADSGSFTSSGAFEPEDLGSETPWNWLRNARAATADDAWEVEASQGEVGIRFTMAAAPATRVILCEFPRTDSFEPPAVPMFIARRRAARTVFVGLLQAEEGEAPPLTLSVSERPHNLLRIALSGESTREFSIPRLT